MSDTVQTDRLLIGPLSRQSAIFSCSLSPDITVQGAAPSERLCRYSTVSAPVCANKTEHRFFVHKRESSFLYAPLSPTATTQLQNTLTGQTGGEILLDNDYFLP